MVIERLQQQQAYGEAKRVSADELMRALHVSRRELFHLIQIERDQGAPILSQKRNGGGYFLPLNKYDLQLCAGRLLREGAATQRAAQKMIDAWAGAK